MVLNQTAQLRFSTRAATVPSACLTGPLFKKSVCHFHGATRFTPTDLNDPELVCDRVSLMGFLFLGQLDFSDRREYPRDRF